MKNSDFGVDIEDCRRNLQAREQQRYREREARRQSARAAILAALREILPHHPELRRAYLFGSVNRPGDFHAQSDVDLAVEALGRGPGKGLYPEQYFALWHELNEKAPGWVIDLRDLDENSRFSAAVRQRGELVYEREAPVAQS